MRSELRLDEINTDTGFTKNNTGCIKNHFEYLRAETWDESSLLSLHNAIAFEPRTKQYLLDLKEFFGYSCHQVVPQFSISEDGVAQLRFLEMGDEATKKLSILLQVEGTTIFREKQTEVIVKKLLEWAPSARSEREEARKNMEKWREQEKKIKLAKLIAANTPRG
jgi:hypothetical protein